MTRVRRSSELAGMPRCTARSPRRRRQCRKPTRSEGARWIRLVAVLVLMSVGVGLWTIPVRRVVVTGVTLSDRERVAEVGRSLMGQHWLTIDTGAVVETLGQDEWVEEVRVRRSLFGRVEIRVREHEALFACADDHGGVVTCCATRVPCPKDLDRSSLPTLAGLPEEMSFAASTLHEVLYALRSPRWPFRREVEAVNLESPGGVEFVLEDGTQVWLGENHFESRLQWLTADPGSWRRSGVKRIDLRFERQVVVASERSLGQGS